MQSMVALWVVMHHCSAIRVVTLQVTYEGGKTGGKGAHLEALRRRLVQRTVALVERPEATSCPMVLSTAALGARRLG